MSNRRRNPDDPLVLRVHAAAKQIEDLRARGARLQAERDAAREQLAAARGRIQEMESQRGLARQRIEHILETIHA